MKKLVATAALALTAGLAQAQTQKWAIDASHAKIGFTVSHFGISETDGRFTKFDGTVLSDKPDFADAKISFTIDAASVNTENTDRDKHLRSADFFETDKYPRITFVGKSLKATGKNTYQLSGDLTMHGVTRPVVFEAAYRGTVVDPYQHTKAGFRISGTLDRALWGLKWNGKLSTGDALIGDQIPVAANVELQKEQ